MLKPLGAHSLPNGVCIYMYIYMYVYMHMYVYHMTHIFFIKSWYLSFVEPLGAHSLAQQYAYIHIHTYIYTRVSRDTFYTLLTELGLASMCTCSCPTIYLYLCTYIFTTCVPYDTLYTQLYPVTQFTRSCYLSFLFSL